MFFFKRRHKKHKNRQKWSQDPASQSTRKKFYMTPTETDQMYDRVRESLSCTIRVLD